ncbi:LysR family transcriptional regulator [Naasia lichenicola]|uniref:LysR family transcriptional regulator n=1 Tax=Naasia lichenicola TaxID=2565933 RepID=A0A4V3WTW4_9MICO|nr:LysR family transcriptional regulator [Naasia lichenicola]THG33527.1 LysR family transcriptional regulator [Naasia lichenicola]
MDTDALRWFQQVADGTTVTEVSELEGLTQPGVSRALARLERDVGAPLLQRTGRTLRMTRAGAIFKRYVDVVLHELDDGLSAVNDEMSPDSGTVVIAFQGSLGTWLIPNLLASFRAEHPDIRFELNQIRDEIAAPRLLAEGADILITTTSPRSDDVGWRPLMVEPLRLATHRDHPLAEQESIALRQASAESFVTLRAAYRLRRLTDALCQAAGFEPQVAFEGDDVPTLLGLVAAGLGVAIVPAHHTDVLERPSVRYLELTDSAAYRTVSIGWSTTRRLRPSAELFRTHVIATARQSS